MEFALEIKSVADLKEFVKKLDEIGVEDSAQVRGVIKIGGRVHKLSVKAEENKKFNGKERSWKQ